MSPLLKRVFPERGSVIDASKDCSSKVDAPSLSSGTESPFHSEEAITVISSFSSAVKKPFP